MLRKLYPNLIADPALGGGGAVATPPIPSTAPPTPTPFPTNGPSQDADVFSKFDEAFKGGDEPPKPEPKPATAPPRATPPPVAKTGEPKPAAAPAEGEFEDHDGIQVPKSLKLPKEGNFRAWGLNGYKKAKDLERQLTEKAAIETEYAELKASVPKTVAEKRAIESQLAALRKEHELVMGEFKLVRYEASPEYKEKYQVPYHAAINHALAEVKELLVEAPDPAGELDESGNVRNIERQATQSDFEAVFSQPLGQATKLAKKLFGDASSIVLAHRQKIKDLANAGQAAVAEYKTKGAAIEKQQREAATLEQGQVADMWKNFNERLAGDPKAKDLWGEEGVPEIDAEIKKGLALADKRFGQEYNALPTKDKVALDALIRHRVAASFKLAKKLTVVAAENEQLKRDIAELRGSGPGAPGPNGEPAPTGDNDSPMDAFDKRFTR